MNLIIVRVKLTLIGIKSNKSSNDLACGIPQIDLT